MKYTIFSLALAFIFTLSSCKKEDNPKSDTVKGVSALVQDGSWRVTYFFDDTDETSHFTNFNFTFGADNVLTASNGTTTYTGIWSVSDSNSNDDNMSDLHFNIAFSSPADFEDLTDDWNFESKSETQLKLIDVSGGGGGTDYLTFEKN